jgi:hypothetical protein
MNYKLVIFKEKLSIEYLKNDAEIKINEKKKKKSV